MKRTISIIITSALFTFFHYYAYNIEPTIDNYKQKIRFYYYRIKYFRQPIKLQMWLIKEIIKQNNEMTKYINEFNKAMNKPIDREKIT